MDNMKKFFSQAAADFTTSEPPSWIRAIRDYYQRTGSIRPEDAVRLSGTVPEGTILTADLTAATSDPANDPLE